MLPMVLGVQAVFYATDRLSAMTVINNVILGSDCLSLCATLVSAAVQHD